MCVCVCGGGGGGQCVKISKRGQAVKNVCYARF